MALVKYFKDSLDVIQAEFSKIKEDTPEDDVTDIVYEVYAGFLDLVDDIKSSLKDIRKTYGLKERDVKEWMRQNDETDNKVNGKQESAQESTQEQSEDKSNTHTESRQDNLADQPANSKEEPLQEQPEDNATLEQSVGQPLEVVKEESPSKQLEQPLEVVKEESKPKRKVPAKKVVTAPRKNAVTIKPN